MSLMLRTLHRSIRTYFSSSGVGIDQLRLSREQYAARNASSIESFKKRFLDSVKQSEAQIYTEDLRNMILAANTDDEINGVVEGLRKYNTSKFKFTEFHFGSPVMRLLSMFNKPDLAMKLFMDENLKEIFRDAGSALVLMNKLLEEKRYDDALKVFDYGCTRGFTSTTGRAFPSDVLMLAVEALYRQNTKAALEKLKEVLRKARSQEAEINPRTTALAALLAIEQDEAPFAMEMLGALRTANLTTIRNIRAICLAELGRTEEAMNVVHLMAEQPPVDNDRRRVFPLVLKHLRKAIEKSNDADAQSRFEDLEKFISTNNRLSPVDLLEFLDEPINRRTAVSQNRPGLQQTATNANFRQTPGSNRRSMTRPTVADSMSPPPPSSSSKENPSKRRETKSTSIGTTATSPIPQRLA